MILPLPAASLTDSTSRVQLLTMLSKFRRLIDDDATMCLGMAGCIHSVDLPLL